METLFIIVLIVLLIIYFLAQDSKKTTTKERYGEAIGELAHMTADKISGIAHSITEPADKKKIRLAKKELAYRNGCLYRYEWYTDKEYLNRLLTVDDKFKSSLNVLGLSEERWHVIAHKLLYIGVIRVSSRDSSDYTKKTPKFIRERMVNEWSKNKTLKENIDMLHTALNYFNIKVEEWIEYGDAVVEMYDLYDSNDLKEFGIITSIMPMKNNLHLL